MDVAQVVATVSIVRAHAGRLVTTRPIAIAVAARDAIALATISIACTGHAARSDRGVRAGDAFFSLSNRGRITHRMTRRWQNDRPNAARQ